MKGKDTSQEKTEIEIVLKDGTKYINQPNKGKNFSSVKAIQRQFRIYGYYEITLENKLKKHIKKEMVKSVGEIKI